MTSSAVKTHTYNPHIVVPYIPRGSLLRLVVGVHYVDNGLSAAERDAIDGQRLKRPLILVAAVQWLIPVAVVMTALGATTSLGGMSAGGLGLAGAGVLVLAAGILSELRLRSEKKRLDALTDELEARGVLVRAVEDTVAADLNRIRAVLRDLHDRGNTSLDDQARGAVDKVVRQNAHRPTEKQRAIAASDAMDGATVSIRSAAANQSARWAADVAAAELGIRELQAAGAESGRE